MSELPNNSDYEEALKRDIEKAEGNKANGDSDEGGGDSLGEAHQIDAEEIGSSNFDSY